MGKSRRKKEVAERALLPSKDVRKGKWKDWLPVGALVLLSFVTFANSLSNGFAFDDEMMIARNRLIKDVANLPRLFASHYWAGTPEDEEAFDPRGNLYRPLVMATFALNHAVGGLNPFGFHLVNLLLHIAVSILLYTLARQLGLSSGAALASSALFAVHPLHTEAVSGVVGRAEVLMALGVLAALQWYRQAGAPAPLAFPWVLASWAAFAMGLLSKEQAMLLPALLVLSDLSVGREPGTWKALLLSVWRRYLGYGLILGAYLGLRIAVLGRFFDDAKAFPFVDNPLAHIGGFARALTAVKVAGKYLGLLVWPAQFSGDYSYNSIPITASLLAPAVLAALAAWGGLLGLAVYSGLRGSGHALFAIGLTVITFFPASNLLVPIGTIMGERLFYLPSAGLCLLIGVGWDTVRRWANEMGRLRPVTWGGLVVLVLVLVPLTLRSITRNPAWRDTKTLMERAVEVVPQSAKVHYNLGMLSAEPEQAIRQLDEATRIYPEYRSTNGGLNAGYGTALLRLGRTKEAIEPLERAVALRPKLKTAQYNLGLAYARNEQWAEAEQALRMAIALDFENPSGYNSLSFVLRRQERYEEALAAADEAIRLKPDLAEAHYNRGQIMEGLGRWQEAATSYQQALRLKPDMALAASHLEQVRRRLAR